VLADRHPGSVVISAHTGEGVTELLRAVADRVRALTDVVELLVPYDRGDLLAAVHREGEVLSEAHEDGGVRVRARLDDASRGRFTDLLTP
jgi:GTP-binding protein HflX